MWSKPVGQDDMTMLRDVSDEAVAENLKHRLNAGIIYVSIQFNILLTRCFSWFAFLFTGKKGVSTYYSFQNIQNLKHTSRLKMNLYFLEDFANAARGKKMLMTFSCQRYVYCLQRRQTGVKFQTTQFLCSRVVALQRTAGKCKVIVTLSLSLLYWIA